MAAHHQIMALHEERTNWNVIVRVTTIWPTVSEDGDVLRHNLILLDSLSTRIHATSTPEIWSQFIDFVNEGKLYNIRNFSVVQSNGNYRPVRHPFSIILIPQTLITSVEISEASIPRYKFDIKPFADLPEYSGGHGPLPQNQFSTDVIGVVEDLAPVQLLPSNLGEVQLVSFTICDGRQSIRVRLAGWLFPDLANFYEKFGGTPMIVILAGIKITLFKGYPIVYGLPCTRIYVNLECSEVFQIRHRLAAEGYQGFRLHS